MCLFIGVHIAPIDFDTDILSISARDLIRYVGVFNINLPNDLDSSAAFL